MKTAPALLAVSLAILSACTTDDVSLGTTDGQEPELINAPLETAYPAVGYLMIDTIENSAFPLGPYCAATLIAPRVVLTAASCITKSRGVTFAVGFGNPRDEEFIFARKVFIHPQYDGKFSEHDLAVLRLERDAPVEPMAYSTGEAFRSDGLLRMVAYGRPSPGNINTTTISRRTGADILVTGGGTRSTFRARTFGGGVRLCWGDGGSPAIRVSDGKVLGIHPSLLDVSECKTEAEFVSLEDESAFIDAAIECFDSGTCPLRKYEPSNVEASCKYPCGAYGYKEKQFYAGWRCMNGCLFEAPERSCRWKCADYGYRERQCYKDFNCVDGCLHPSRCP